MDKVRTLLYFGSGEGDACTTAQPSYSIESSSRIGMMYISPQCHSTHAWAQHRRMYQRTIGNAANGKQHRRPGLWTGCHVPYIVYLSTTPATKTLYCCTHKYRGMFLPTYIAAWNSAFDTHGLLATYTAIDWGGLLLLCHGRTNRRRHPFTWMYVPLEVCSVHH